MCTTTSTTMTLIWVRSQSTSSAYFTFVFVLLLLLLCFTQFDIASTRNCNDFSVFVLSIRASFRAYTRCRIGKRMQSLYKCTIGCVTQGIANQSRAVPHRIERYQRDEYVFFDKQNFAFFVLILPFTIFCLEDTYSVFHRIINNIITFVLLNMNALCSTYLPLSAEK